MTQYWGGTRHFFLLNLYNFKNIGGARAPPAPNPPPPLLQQQQQQTLYCTQKITSIH